MILLNVVIYPTQFVLDANLWFIYKFFSMTDGYDNPHTPLIYSFIYLFIQLLNHFINHLFSLVIQWQELLMVPIKSR